MIQMVDATELSTSSGTPSTGAEAGVHGLAAAEQEIPVTDDAGATEAAVEPDFEKEKDYDAARAEHNARRGKSLVDKSVDTELAIH
ncbi:hypothetical protein Tco_1342483, partial [Tanacetum coccineum]